MKKRENEALERYKSLHENRLRLAQEEMRKINESAEARQSFINNYHAIRERKALKESQHSKLMEAARNDALATVIKAIYITALEAESLMDENILLAENMVDKWIEEAGGASKILAKTGNNTYLLSRITQIVEEAAEEAVKEIEEAEEEEPKTNEVPDENASKDVQIAQLTAKDAEIKAQIANLKAEKKAEDEEEKSEEEAEKDAEPTTETPAKEESKEDEDGKETSNTPEEEVPSEGEEKSEEEPEAAEDGKEESDTPDEATPTEDGESEEEEVDADIEIKDVPAEDSENTKELPKEEEEKSDEKSEAPTEAEGEKAPTDGEETAPSEAEGEETPAGGEESESAPEEAEGEEGSDEDDIDPDADINMNDNEKELTDGDEVDPDEDASEDDDVEDALGEPLDGNDGTDADTTVDGDTENKGKIFDDLENEDDVQKAIELIRTRVADAEETFIRNNAEDKKKIDELLNKISTNVKTVETLAEKDPKKAQVATEAVREYKRKINDVYKDKSFTVFGKMASILTESIVKDDAIRESYTTEDGTLDVDLAVESAKVMYGFLETLNTIQIEKVDEKYIANIINGMK